jgi:HEAT repeat protein
MVNWKPFLALWSCELMKTGLASRLDPPAESDDWLGFAPATEKDINELERRLGVLLPPSYKSFLLTSNGWRRTTPFVDRIRSSQDVDWFRVENENWIDAYSDTGSEEDDEEYFEYVDGGNENFRAEHLPHLLQISDNDDGVYLLNPEAVTPDGEWEAWFFANWIPGAQRHPSFAHLMLHEYRSFAQLENVSGVDEELPELQEVASDVPRIRAERNPKKSRAKLSDLGDLIEQLRSTDNKERAKAVRAIGGKLRGRNEAQRRPDLVPKLVDLFYASADRAVRCICVSALTELAEDAPPPPLFDALSDSDPGVFLTGVFALRDFPDDRALEPLCRFIESRANPLFNENAMQQLGEMGDERAVPTLAGVLLDTKNQFDQSFGSAAIALAQCGEAGFKALASVVEHEDARVRRAAVVGLDVSEHPLAAALLDRCEFDPDPGVSQRAKIRMGGSHFKKRHSD